MSYSEPTQNPTGGVVPRRADTPPALSENLMARIVSRPNMQRAWKRVKANQGAPGCDGMTLEEFPDFVRQHWATVRQALLDGSYRPSPVLRVMIPKRSGGKRPLGIPTVTDRVIQQAILQVLSPIFDPDFSESSFGFRPGRSAHGALRQVQRLITEGYRVAVDLDLARFFDEVQHDVLMVRVARKVSDKVLLRLIGRYLRAGVMVEGTLQPTEKGTPQGGPLSPLLANILLDDLDKELERRGHRFARYADDIRVLATTVRAGDRIMSSVTRYLTRVLKLVVNEQKSWVVPTNQCQFLGFTFRGTKLRWSDQSYADFRHRLRRLTGRSWGVSMAYRLAALGRYLRGWMNYFGISQYYRPIPELDHWLRRRVRMCYWKQWRKPRTRIRHLIKLGAGRKHAIFTGLSRKSYWHLSKTLATQTGMTNQWLAEQGLLSVRDLWLKAQGYA
jgi:RNA-directed DNA polymerase